MQDIFIGSAAGGSIEGQSSSERKVTPYSSKGASQTSVQIYVVYNKPASILQSPIFKPIQTGRANTDLRLEMIGDDTGDNISSRNGRFCELSALYWIWKNDKISEYIGLFHYRRHLNLSGTDRDESEWGCTEFPVIDQDYQEQNGLTLTAVNQIITSYDIVLPRPWNVTAAGCKNIYEHYRKGTHHYISDYETALRIVRHLYPDYTLYIERVNQSETGHFTNLFIMRRDIFDHYCEWLFNILFLLDEELNLRNYSMQEYRALGYISERLFNIYIIKLREDRPDLRILDAQRTFVKHTDLTGSVEPVFGEDAVAIVMSFHQSFVPYAGTALRSLIDQTSSSNDYDIVIIESSISQADKARLVQLAASHANIAIRFHNASGFFGRIELPVHMHFSAETYNRLMIPEVFCRYKRVVYIDGDIIVCRDIAGLARTGLEGYPLAAVRDYTMQGFRKYRVPSAAECGSLPAEDYLRHYLGMRNPELYFQTGVMVFDVPALKTIDFNRWRHLIEERRYWFADQDIMNIILEGHVKYLEMDWNVMHGNGQVAAFYDKLPLEIRNSYMRARRNPFIIHYAGERKPWKDLDIDFADVFWAMARQTPWYEKILMTHMQEQRGITGSAMQELHHHHHYHHKLEPDILLSVMSGLRKLSSKLRGLLKI